MTESKRVELLAPAGNPSVALSAFDAGADAVYCGLRKFNARERSENFTHDDLSRMVAYAHKLRRKVYVTFNTLLKESELDEAAREMAFLAEIRPDAVIVQNLGAARIMREYFPDLTLHASTQLGIHNSSGLEMAKKFGFQRVILERQVTLDELRKMVPDGKPPLEMELFIHGALCCCVSGSCLFSSWLGGWSGNR
ncbi:MAG: U32 family peptidase, partial [Lentisphaeria bacterium]|nr:U32 family peptidase [Lentisphaeria bacterium]